MKLLARIVLASASPRRLELLQTLGCDVVVRKSDYDEPDDDALSPRELAQRHAHNKCVDVARHFNGDALIVAADTVVDLDNVALNKPVDAADATRMLRALSGREHVVHTAVACNAFGTPLAFTSSTRVRFHALHEADIARYVATGEPMDKAGSYGIQGLAASLVDGIAGDFYTVMGFPLGRFIRELRVLGFSFPAENKNKDANNS